MSKNNNTQTTTVAEVAAAFTPRAVTPVEPAKEVKVERAYVRSMHGPFIHPYTNEKITSDGKKVDLDNWVRVQIEAGKLALVTD